MQDQWILQCKLLTASTSLTLDDISIVTYVPVALQVSPRIWCTPPYSHPPESSTHWHCQTQAVLRPSSDRIRSCLDAPSLKFWFHYSFPRVTPSVRIDCHWTTTIYHFPCSSICTCWHPVGSTLSVSSLLPQFKCFVPPKPWLRHLWPTIWCRPSLSAMPRSPLSAWG